MILSAISGLKERVDRVEFRQQGSNRVVYITGHGEKKDNVEEVVVWRQGNPEPKLGKVLKTKDINELQTGTEIYLPDRGVGRIISISYGPPRRFDMQFGMEKVSIELKESHLAQFVIRTDEA